jgi:pimeloyl-ACP methyl ester carboxylesterase
MPTAKVGDVEIYYEIHGAGEPLVLIPGFGNGLWIWYKQINDFSRTFQTIVFDPRGISRSSKASGPISIRLLAEDLAGLLEKIGVKRTHVLGASFGGFVAQEFALAYPDMLRRLVLCCTSFGGPNHIAPSIETLQAMASTKGLNTGDRVRANLLLAFSPRFLEEQPEDVERIVALRASNDVPENVYLQQLSAAMAFNTEDRVAEIAAPTLVITGDKDVIVPPQNSRNLVSKLHNVELELIPDGSHTFFIEQPDIFNARVEAFLTRSLKNSNSQ